MDCSRVLPVCLLLLATLLNAPCSADEFAEKGRAIFKQHQQAVISVQTVVRSALYISGRPGQTNESHMSISGTVVTPSGLTVVSLAAIDPGQALRTMAAAKDPRLKVDSQLTDMKILLPDGTEMPGEVALRDADLDLALIRPKTKPAAPLAALDLTQSGKAEVLDQVIALNRLGVAAGRVYSASVERISAVVEQPHPFYVPDSNMTTATLGAPAFTLDGKVLGVFLLRTAESKAAATAMSSPAENMTGIILPASEILKAVQRVPAASTK